MCITVNSYQSYSTIISLILTFLSVFLFSCTNIDENEKEDFVGASVWGKVFVYGHFVDSILYPGGIISLPNSNSGKYDTLCIDSCYTTIKDQPKLFELQYKIKAVQVTDTGEILYEITSNESGVFNFYCETDSFYILLPDSIARGYKLTPPYLEEYEIVDTLRWQFRHNENYNGNKLLEPEGFLYFRYSDGYVYKTDDSKSGLQKITNCNNIDIEVIHFFKKDVYHVLGTDLICYAPASGYKVVGIPLLNER